MSRSASIRPVLAFLLALSTLQGAAAAELAAFAASVLDRSDPSFEYALLGKAAVKLNQASAGITLTSDTQWSLSKTGAIDPATSTVTWTITATEGTTTAGHLVVHGTMTVGNGSLGAATIGNIVVNLQAKSGSGWTTRSSDIADATQDDAATSAVTVGASYSENSASGDLQFMDAETNSIFSLVPQVLIPGGTTRTLLFSASFNNNVLSLAPGTQVRAEVIVSFGNSSSNGQTGSNLDINGNGTVDSDETVVRSISSRLTLTVPQSTPGNAAPVLTDTIDDITTTGSVTFSNPVFDLGATGGTVRVSYDAGSDGGTITNCAHLTSPDTSVTTGGFSFASIDGVDLLACDTQAIGNTCTPGAAGCGWEEGDMHTWTQGEWGDESNNHPAALLIDTSFNQVYPSGTLEVGIPGTAGFSAVFDSNGVLDFLPTLGNPGPLTSDLFNPTTSSSGVFGGEVIALELNTDFSSTGLLSGVTAFSSLNICGVPGLSNMSVASFVALANSQLGGAGSFSISTLTSISQSLNAAFIDGAPSDFAQEHLVNGPCSGDTCTPGAAGCGWEEGDMHTFPQGEWGDSPASNPAAALLDGQFNNVYTSGTLEVGIAGNGGFSLVVDSNGALAYLPAPGTPGQLSSDLFNPTSSSAGSFGGDVVSLELNTDFSSAGLLSGVTTFGSLNICGVLGVPNMSVASFLSLANAVLGGGTGPSVATLAPVAAELNASFFGGSPTGWAQEHLVNGPCGGDTCTPGAAGCGWEDGDMHTFPQGDWGDEPSHAAAILLSQRWNTVYAGSFGVIEIGIPGAGGFSIVFDNPDGALAYMPAIGPIGALTTDLVNPTISSSGAFGGEVLALELNTDFSASGFLIGVVPLGTLNLCDVPGLPDMPVDSFLALANNTLGGAGDSVTEISSISTSINLAFINGSPSTFAQEHLVRGACP